MESIGTTYGFMPGSVAPSTTALSWTRCLSTSPLSASPNQTVAMPTAPAPPYAGLWEGSSMPRPKPTPSATTVSR